MRALYANGSSFLTPVPALRPRITMRAAQRMVRNALKPQTPDAARDDRDILFTILSNCLGWMEASDATQAVLDRFGSFTSAIEAEAYDLAVIPGVGTVGATAIKAVHTAALRLAAATLEARPLLRSTRSIVAHARGAGDRHSVGETRALYLDARDRLIVDEAVASGGEEALVPSVVLRRALALEAEGVAVLRHTDQEAPVPNDAAIALARRIHAAGSVLGIKLHDVVLLNGRSYASLREAHQLHDGSSGMEACADARAMGFEPQVDPGVTG